MVFSERSTLSKPIASNSIYLWYIAFSLDDSLLLLLAIALRFVVFRSIVSFAADGILPAVILIGASFGWPLSVGDS
ncbi:hypothetical protein SDJN02_15487, partial [Cucurbita argyrosperma subsp. argyrosperma]